MEAADALRLILDYDETVRKTIKQYRCEDDGESFAEFCLFSMDMYKRTL